MHFQDDMNLIQHTRCRKSFVFANWPWDSKLSIYICPSSSLANYWSFKSLWTSFFFWQCPQSWSSGVKTQSMFWKQVWAWWCGPGSLRIPLKHQQCSFCNIVQKRRSVEHMLKNIDVKAFWQHNNDLKRLFKGRIVKILGHIWHMQLPQICRLLSQLMFTHFLKSPSKKIGRGGFDSFWTMIKKYCTIGAWGHP